MGAPMAQRLVNAGHQVKVYDLEEEKAQMVKGATVVGSPALTAQESDYFISMLPYSDDTIDVITGDNGALTIAKPSCVFIDCGTGSPYQTYFLSQVIKDAGFIMLDCPVSGNVNMAEQGQVTMLSSGDETVFNNSKDILSVLASKIEYLGSSNGMGQIMNLALNSMLGTQMAVLAEAIDFGTNCGLDRNQTIDIIKESTMAAPFMKQKLEMLKNNDFTADFQTYLMDKDLMYISELAESNNCFMPLNAACAQLYRAAISSDLDEEDMASIVKIYNKLSPPRMGKEKAA